MNENSVIGSAEQSDRASGSAPTATRFELIGAGVAVEYLAAEAPQLTYRGDAAERVFAAAELRIERTLLGTLATGTLESVPDLEDLTLTLAVPDVNFLEGAMADVETVLVRTRHRTSIGGPSLVDGALQAYESVPLSGTARAVDDEPGHCRDWAAIHHLEPPGPGRLRVTGRCTVPTPGHRVELRRKEPQGTNPADLLLEKSVHEPRGPVARVLTEIDVEYAEETDARMDTVTIVPDGVSIPVQRGL
jgi:hypothetical protein